MIYIRWAFWKIYYFFQPEPKDFHTLINKGIRTRPPWWKFEPNVWYNESGKMWHIWFNDDMCYSEFREMKVDVSISRKTGKIVGLVVYDWQLGKKND